MARVLNCPIVLTGVAATVIAAGSLLRRVLPYGVLAADFGTTLHSGPLAYPIASAARA
jgi:hypothetical protein